MHFPRQFCFLFVFCLCVLPLSTLPPCALAGTPVFVPSPPFSGTQLPTPPRQASPWTPPAGLPAPLISAAGTLFDQGLADPRGGEYRQILVGTGMVWSGDGGVQAVHGWVLPGTATSSHFAVCWNGLVYPVVSVGDRADLAADVAALIKADTDTHAAHDRLSPTEPYDRFTLGVHSEYVSLSEASLLPLKACLLLRLGEDGLARRFWDTWLQGTPPRYNNNDAARRDPYLAMADEWVWALFDRALTAHMRGDDSLSVLSVRQLAALQPVVEAEAGRRGYRTSPSTGVHEAGAPYFPYLDLLPRLRADEERRVQQGSPRPVLANLLALPKAARIAALIRALDQVAARQNGQPGSVNPDSDPIVLALVTQGEDAVQPLIDTVAGDTRLTRSVGFGRDFHWGRSAVSVAGAAFAALVDILHTSEFGPSPDGSSGRAGTVAALQAYWNKNRGVSVEERWYRTLADDRATPAQWLDAAHEIIRPSDEQVRGGWIERGLTRAGAVLPHGEALRRGHAPSVTALMARRVQALRTASGAPPNDSRHFNDVENATTLALYLAAWDPSAAQTTLREQFAAKRSTLDFWKRSIDVTHDSLSLTRLTLARMHGGDPAALADYVGWLKVTPLKDFPIFSLDDILEPLWRTPRAPDAVRGAAFLFGDPRSPWVPLVQDRPGGLYRGEFEKLLESPLLALAPFRRAMGEALADRTVIQTITLGGADRQGTYQMPGADAEIDPFRSGRSPSVSCPPLRPVRLASVAPRGDAAFPVRLAGGQKRRRRRRGRRPPAPLRCGLCIRPHAHSARHSAG